MKIGVLQADTVSEEFQADYGNYPTMFENMLKSAGKQVLGSAIEVAHYNIMQSQFPKKLNECDAYIITGSKKSVYDDEPWIHKFRGFLVELNDAKKIVIGICFGHQLIADALGGKTYRRVPTPLRSTGVLFHSRVSVISIVEYSIVGWWRGAASSAASPGALPLSLTPALPRPRARPWSA